MKIRDLKNETSNEEEKSSTEKEKSSKVSNHF